MKKISIIFMMMAFAFTARAQSPQTYLVVDFAENELETMLDLCHKGGLNHLLQSQPFSTYGHYEWNTAFARDGKTVAQMVHQAENQGVHLGVIVQKDAISLNDAFFTPRYFSHLKRQGIVELFDDINAEQREMAVRKTAAFDQPSTLNLILIEDELVAYATMETAGDLLLLHRCTRGAYGTKSAEHKETAKAFKLWDSKDRFLAPDDYLRDSVRKCLNAKIKTSGLAFVKSADEKNYLGFPIVLADKHRAATSLEELERALVKSVAENTDFGLTINGEIARQYGMMDSAMYLIKDWDVLRHDNALSKKQLEALREPYQDWHLERQNDSLFHLYPINISRRFRCVLDYKEEGSIASESMEWKGLSDGPFGLRIQVDGETAVINPMINTSRGLAMFLCTIHPGQRLVYDQGDYAYLMDANCHVLKKVSFEGIVEMSEGINTVTFMGKTDTKDVLPEVTLRYITREEPMLIDLPPHK